MKYALQRFFAELGESACYAISLVHLAEKITKEPINAKDALGYLEIGIEKKFILYNETNPNDPNNFYVENPTAFLALMTGAQWTISKQDASYVPSPGDHLVVRYRRSTPKGVFYHFVTPDYDPLGESLTRIHGVIDGYRVFRRK